MVGFELQPAAGGTQDLCLTVWASGLGAVGVAEKVRSGGWGWREPAEGVKDMVNADLKGSFHLLHSLISQDLLLLLLFSG